MIDCTLERRRLRWPVSVAYPSIIGIPCPSKYQTTNSRTLTIVAYAVGSLPVLLDLFLPLDHFLSLSLRSSFYLCSCISGRSSFGFLPALFILPPLFWRIGSAGSGSQGTLLYGIPPFFLFLVASSLLLVPYHTFLAYANGVGTLTVYCASSIRDCY